MCIVPTFQRSMRASLRVTLRWNGGGEYYSRTYKARVPRAFENCSELADRFVSVMMDDFVDVAGFWVD